MVTPKSPLSDGRGLFWDYALSVAAIFNEMLGQAYSDTNSATSKLVGDMLAITFKLEPDSLATVRSCSSSSGMMSQVETVNDEPLESRRINLSIGYSIVFSLFFEHTMMHAVL